MRANDFRRTALGMENAGFVGMNLITGLLLACAAAVHFWSLFFPLAVFFPQYRLPLVVLPVLVSSARIAVNHHYLSDILASAALAALVTWVYAIAVLERGLRWRYNPPLQPTRGANTAHKIQES